MSARIALVTGGTAGIGLGIVERLLQDGYIVHTFSRTAERVETLKKSEKLFVSIGSVDDEKFRAQTVKELAERHGRLDVLVNNAGIMRAFGYIEEPLSAWREVLDVNLLGPYAWIQSCYPLLQKGIDPSVINISSVCGLGAYSTCSSTSYSVSKAGLEMLTQRLAYGLGPDGIRVNSIAPGVIATPMWNGAEEKQASVTKQRHVLKGQLGEPSDIAGAVAYLAGSESRLITGASIAIDAGYHLG